MRIDRNDMLELTRRMTSSRTCFSRIAGAYMDEEGFADGTFNTHFLKLSPTEQAKNIALAKVVPFSKTNEQLQRYEFEEKDKKPGGIWQLLMALRECELKNDALLYSFYEYIGERYQPGKTYAIYVYYGAYDVPCKGADKENQWESEEVYQYLICTISPMKGEYDPDQPTAGFLFPAFDNRSTDLDAMNVFRQDEGAVDLAELFELL